MALVGVIWEFIVHSFVGTLLFVILAVPAVFLDLAVNWLEGARGPHDIQVSHDLIEKLKLVASGVVDLDSGLYGVFLLMTSVLMLKGFWKFFRSDKA